MLVVLAGLLTGVGAPASHAMPVLYSPQPGRNAEWDGLPTGFDDASVQAAGANLSYVVVNKQDQGGIIANQLDDVNNLAISGAQQGNQLRVFAYFMSSRWEISQWRTMVPYSSAVPTDGSWYLKDYQGNPIPWYAVGDPLHQQAPKGYLMDTGNPAYQAWVAQMTAQWLLEAQFSGIMLDASNVVAGNAVPMSQIGDGASTWNTMLCGPGTYSGDCRRVTQMNTGLTNLVASVAAVVHNYGMEVAYNGIAPTDNRGASRNLGLLNYADIASDESFCYAADPDGSVHLMNLPRDWSIMATQAGRGKKLFEIVNYYTDATQAQWGNYCTAAFMLGWQPGSSYLIYHRDYSDVIPASPPDAENNLNLGNPTTPLINTPGVYSRKFQNGFVALNATKLSQTFRTPAAMTQFLNGRAVVSYPANAMVTLRPTSAMFFLYNSFLY